MNGFAMSSSCLKFQIKTKSTEKQVQDIKCLYSSCIRHVKIFFFFENYDATKCIFIVKIVNGA